MLTIYVLRHPGVKLCLGLTNEASHESIGADADPPSLPCASGPRRNEDEIASTRHDRRYAWIEAFCKDPI
jgi:hypothetical protein